MIDRLPADTSLRVPPLKSLARRLCRHCRSASLDVDDLLAIAREALWERRDRIMQRPDPVASAYTTARAAMWAAVKRENRQVQLTTISG